MIIELNKIMGASCACVQNLIGESNFETRTEVGIKDSMASEKHVFDNDEIDKERKITEEEDEKKKVYI